MPNSQRQHIVSVIGLGYVGLPVAAAFAEAGFEVVGFDVDTNRVEELRQGNDRTGEVAADSIRVPTLHLTADPVDLKRATFHIVTVPTPITEAKQPDLGMLRAASRTVGGHLKPGDVVVYESTVYPGATEEECVPLLEAESGLKMGQDFGVGYSPERINPGDPTHRFETIVKVVAGCDAATLETVAAVYEAVVTAGIYRSPSIKVAEAAKVIENTQRDLNIALMNELAMIFDRLGLRTRDVLAAAGTKWNFLPFTPGFVGGHCIGVDPYYLTARAQEAGYHPEVILAGRRVNDSMGVVIAQNIIKRVAQRRAPTLARIGILGITFKEDVPDMRNSKVPDMIKELEAFGAETLVHDPIADATEAADMFGSTLVGLEHLQDLDALVVAVPHRVFLDMPPQALARRVTPGGLLVDIKSRLSANLMDGHGRYWSL